MKKIIVLDDDPTGSQTVYGCSLIIKWDLNTILTALRDSSPLFFILINTRAMNENDAKEVIIEVCNLIKLALKIEELSFNDVYVISRGDSTLRGHFFIEPLIINDTIGPFDALFYIPAFIEAGRLTIEGIHCLNGLPLHETSYAKDNIFGFKDSNLVNFLVEKSNSQITKERVKRISKQLLEKASKSRSDFKLLQEMIIQFSNFQYVVVDIENYIHMNTFCSLVKSLENKKRFLFRSAASLINGLSRLNKNKLDLLELNKFRVLDIFNQPKPGIIIIGSHVEIANKQLIAILEEEQCQGIELSVEEIYENINSENGLHKMKAYREYITNKIFSIFECGKTPILYTSRKEKRFNSTDQKIIFCNNLAIEIALIIRGIYQDLGYIISKGGITTNILLRDGLLLNQVHLQGQIVPGLSLVYPDVNNSLKNLPIVTFPGNFGQTETLKEIWQMFEA
tara:strand:+ start:7671 stop:9026 length:1356 start_codon:yes stop_codon:yes gene_type:complete